MTYILYPSINDFHEEETEMEDADFDEPFDYSRREIVKLRNFGDGFRVGRLASTGTYYVNIKNMINVNNGYYLNISRAELPSL